MVCVFVNDRLDRACIAALAASGVKLIALRCAGFNNVDLAAAREHGIPVVRVPAYSPHAVAEHTVALLLTLNRKIHRAYNRVRDQNFSLGGLVGFDLHGKTVGIVGTGLFLRLGENSDAILKENYDSVRAMNALTEAVERIDSSFQFALAGKEGDARRVYADHGSIPKVLGGMGVAVISTSQGLLTGQEARRKGVGGEILCTVW